MDTMVAEIDGFCNTPSIGDDLIPCISNFDFPQYNKGGALPDLNSNLFLGKRMEIYFQHVIEASNRYDILASNIQLIEEKQTKGELDYILFDNEEGQAVHVELAYKFYLLDPEIEGEQINQWIGPNRNDSLIKKLNKLTNHQFPLLNSELANKALSEINIPEIKQQLCLKAKLYLPFDFSGEVNTVNPSCIVGKWLTLEQLTEFKDHQFFIPEKRN